LKFDTEYPLNHGKLVGERLFFRRVKSTGFDSRRGRLDAGQIRGLAVPDPGVLRVKSGRAGINTFVYIAFHTRCMNQT
jgi:hypothetical protein